MTGDNPYEAPTNSAALRGEPVGDERLLIRPRKTFLSWDVLRGLAVRNVDRKHVDVLRESWAERAGIENIPSKAFVASILFGHRSRETRRRLDRRAPVDDIGFCFIDGERRLCFLGEAVSLRLGREDLSALRQKRAYVIGSELELVLTETIADQISLRLRENSRWISGIGGEAVRFAKSLTEWFNRR